MMIFLVLMMSEVTLSTLVAQRITALEQESSYAAADKILDMLLLSPGDPANWENNTQTEPLSLGLAEQNSLKAYVLDPCKVTRLLEGSPGYISPAKARSLLGLRLNYCFSIRFSPIFNVSVERNGNLFTLTIRNTRGFLTPNVNVTAHYVPQSLVPGVEYEAKSNMTSLDGRCTLEFQYEPNFAMIMQAEQLGVKVVATYPSGLKFTMEGGRVFQSNTPIIAEIDYSTGSSSTLDRESVSRHAEIGGSAYLVEFSLWS